MHSATLLMRRERAADRQTEEKDQRSLTERKKENLKTEREI